MIKLTEANYDAETSKGTFVALISASWCGKCSAFKPAFNVLGTKMEGVGFGIANVADDESLSEKLSVTNLPTTIVYKDGKEVGRTSEMKSVESMQEWIEGLTK